MIVFTDNYLAELWRRPYFEEYTIKANVFTVYKPIDGNPVPIFACISALGYVNN